MYFTKVIDHILPEATEEEALEWAAGICEYEITPPQTISCADFVDHVNGLDVYYDYGADYYFFVEVG